MRWPWPDEHDHDQTMGTVLIDIKHVKWVISKCFRYSNNYVSCKCICFSCPMFWVLTLKFHARCTPWSSSSPSIYCRGGGGGGGAPLEGGGGGGIPRVNDGFPDWLGFAAETKQVWLATTRVRKNKSYAVSWLVHRVQWYGKTTR